jgi:predicted nuclease with TOPRIM domain
MNEQLQKRLMELRSEYAAGEERLAALNAETTQLRDTMLRISGAIQVLEEELSKSEAVGSEPERTSKASA